MKPINKQTLTISAIPNFSEMFYSYRISRILKKRDRRMVEQEWLGKGFSFAELMPIFDIICEFCNWNRRNFLPQDELAYIIKSYGMQMTDVSVIMALEDRFSTELSCNERTVEELAKRLLR